MATAATIHTLTTMKLLTMSPLQEQPGVPRRPVPTVARRPDDVSERPFSSAGGMPGRNAGKSGLLLLGIVDLLLKTAIQSCVDGQPARSLARCRTVRGLARAAARRRTVAR